MQKSFLFRIKHFENSQDQLFWNFCSYIPVRPAIDDREKNSKSLVSAGVSGGGGSRGGDIGGGAGQSSYPLQAFCNSSNLLRLLTHFSRI